MNAAYVHIALNHVPILGTVFGLLLLAADAVRGNQTLRRAGWVTLVVVALVAIPVYLTGEGAEELVEDSPGVAHDDIESHEELALYAFIAMEALGLLALVALFASRRGAGPAWLATAVLVLAVVTAALMGLTAERGGRIKHPELHATPGAVAPHE